MPLLSRRSGPSESYQTFANEASIENHENIANFSRPQDCSLCNIILKHKESVEKIIRKAKDNHPKINSTDFKLKPICTIKTPEGHKNLNLEDIGVFYVLRPF